MLDTDVLHQRREQSPAFQSRHLCPAKLSLKSKVGTKIFSSMQRRLSFFSKLLEKCPNGMKKWNKKEQGTILFFGRRDSKWMRSKGDAEDNGKEIMHQATQSSCPGLSKKLDTLGGGLQEKHEMDSLNKETILIGPWQRYWRT